MEAFAVEVDLVTPAIIETLTLDGLLGAILFDELQDVERAHAAIPLRCSSSLFHASCAHPIGPKTTSSLTFVAALRATHDLDLDLIKCNDSGQPHRKLGLARRKEFGNVRNAYSVYTSPTLRWEAEGDPEHVLELLESVEFIGKRRASGCGQVRGWRLDVSESNGIFDAARQPLRPVPWSMWTGDSNALRAEAAWRPAYWRPEHRAICAVPRPLWH